MKNIKIWQVYLIYNPVTRRTYIGASTDVDRRLREHNGLKKGGPKATKAGMPHWILVAYIHGFEGQSEAYRWEKVIKMRARGLQARRDTMLALTKGIVPEGITKRPLSKLLFIEVTNASKINI